MALDYLVEIIKSYPTFSSRVSSDERTVFIFPNIETEVVLSGSHRDRSYSSRIERCKELDCSEFYTSAVAAGAVSLCGECEEQVSPTPPTPPSGGCANYSTLNSFNFTPPDNLKVENGTIDQTQQSYNNYLSWSNQSENNSAFAKSGYWLGLSPCGGDCRGYSCIVGCQSGVVTGCWCTGSSPGSGNTGSNPSFGSVYTIGGQNYQVYDPLQIYLAGLRPNGGSFTLLSSNPLANSSAMPAGGGSTDCGRSIVVIDPSGGGGGGGGDEPNCFEGNGGCPSCSDGENPWTPTPANTAFPEPVAIIGGGDFSFRIVSTGSNCYSFSPSQLTSFSGAFSLGGANGISAVEASSLGISASTSCGQCTGKNLSDSGGVNGPSCCQLSCGGINITGSPEFTGTGWSSSGETWNNFWPNNTYDNGYRKLSNSGAWGSCSGGVTRASSVYTSPCNPTQYCESNKRKGVILVEQNITNETTGECPCYDFIYPPNAGCSLTQMVHNCGVDEDGNECKPQATPIVDAGCPPGKRRYFTIPIEDSCNDSACQSTFTIGDSSCSAKIPISFNQFFTCLSFESNEDSELSEGQLTTLSRAAQYSSNPQGSAGDCNTFGACGAIGNVTKATIKGPAGSSCIEDSPCPSNLTLSGLFNTSFIAQLLGRVSNTPDNGVEVSYATCCSKILQSPWYPTDGNGETWEEDYCEEEYEPDFEDERLFNENNCFYTDPCQYYGCR